MINFLKKLGYKDPRHYKVCCGTDHVTLVESNHCPNCDTPKEKCIDYFVLGLNLDLCFQVNATYTIILHIGMKGMNGLMLMI